MFIKDSSCKKLFDVNCSEFSVLVLLILTVNCDLIKTLCIWLISVSLLRDGMGQ